MITITVTVVQSTGAKSQHVLTDPSLATVYQIAEAFGCSIADLLDHPQHTYCYCVKCRNVNGGAE